MINTLGKPLESSPPETVPATDLSQKPKVGKSGLILGKSGLKKLITQKVVSSHVSSCEKWEKVV